jgi:hypothetical protein
MQNASKSNRPSRRVHIMRASVLEPNTALTPGMNRPAIIYARAGAEKL